MIKSSSGAASGTGRGPHRHTLAHGARHGLFDGAGAGRVATLQHPRHVPRLGDGGGGGRRGDPRGTVPPGAARSLSGRRSGHRRPLFGKDGGAPRFRGVVQPRSGAAGVLRMDSGYRALSMNSLR